MRGLRVAAVLVAGTALLTGCGSSDRPEDLSLSEVKPCQLIMQSRYKTLNITRGPILIDSDFGVGTKGSSCKYLLVYPSKDPVGVNTNAAVKLTAITNEGVHWKVDEASDSSNFDYKNISSINGYRAVRVWSTYQSPGPNTDCTLYVDVADEQMLRVNARMSSGDDDPPTCDTARQFAKVALKTLRAWQD